MDLSATVVDAAPFIAVAGTPTHVNQILSIKFTAPASVFRNVKTMAAFHGATMVATPVILVCQGMGLQHRNYVTRWAHERELRQDEEVVRQHIDVGMMLGAMGWVSRLVFQIGTRYWAAIEVIAGGALADVLHREYLRAHGG